MASDQKYCPNCGTPHTREVVFCTSCGTKFPETTPETSNMPSTEPINNVSPQTTKSDFLTLSCPNCGGKLEITPDIERFACQHCGYEHIVRRIGGIVSLEPVVQMLGQITNGFSHVGNGMNRLSFNTEKQAAELTIKRLKEEIDELQAGMTRVCDKRWGVMAPGFVLLSCGGAAILVSVGGLVPIDIGLIIAGILIPIGIILIAASKNVGKKDQEAIEQQVKQKETELQRNYDFVKQFE